MMKTEWYFTTSRQVYIKSIQMLCISREVNIVNKKGEVQYT